MYRAMGFVFASLLVTTPAAAQTASADTQLTQALIGEIRQLRLDLQATAATIQRMQLVMFRAQAETQLMARATQRLDDARAKCSQLQSQRKMESSQVDVFEQRLRNAQNPAEQKNAAEFLPRVKASLEMLTNEEQQCQSREADAESQFRAEQAKMTELQDQMDKLDKILDGSGKK